MKLEWPMRCSSRDPELRKVLEQTARQGDRVSYFSITTFTLRATVKSDRVTLTLRTLSNDRWLVAALLWESL